MRRRAERSAPRRESPADRPPAWVLVLLAATLLLLLGHAWFYLFLTDDAFISFRYARNLAQGHGLVFNPGQERVEGYTNFLWVLLLAACRLLGAAPERAAPALSLAATVALWGLLVAYTLAHPPKRRQKWLLVVAPLLLAATRSVAVWSSSGLETRLFEALTLGGVLGIVREVRAARAGGWALRPVSGLLLGLACLARPDGILIAVCSLAAGAWSLRRHSPARWLARSGGTWAGIVGAHFLFRVLYYGAWLPNTYYAKVGGRTWWEMGLAHHASFALEYGLVLWVPALVAAVRFHRGEGSGFVPLICAAATVPHALYVAAIGGDHFEYRPQDLYFPFGFLLLYDGWRGMGRGKRAVGFVPAHALAVLGGLTLLALPSHRGWPQRYANGFPGRQLARPEGRAFLDPEEGRWRRLPLLRLYARAHRDLVRHTTASLVGIRQEEHVRFLEKVMPEALRLRSLVESGRLRPEAYFAMDCVGAIPYYSGLRVLDRHGLTDAHVARSETYRGVRVMAHDKRASLAYARERGVDFWAFDPVHSLWRVTDPGFRALVRLAAERGIPAYVAEAGEGYSFLGLLPRGPQRAATHLPGFTFHPLLDPETLRAIEKAGAQQPDSSSSRSRPSAGEAPGTRSRDFRGGRRPRQAAN